MLFDSVIYFVFLVLVALAYWRLGFRGQNYLLLAASYFFYGWWDWRFLALMIGSTLLDWVIAIRIEDSSSQKSRRAWFLASLILNFSILGFFKYCNFFLGSLAPLLHGLGFGDIPIRILTIVLPPGISFYTFQEVAYIVDVYRRTLKPARSFLEYSLFISLFPHLIAGPIQRPGHLLPQVQRPRIWNTENAFDGILLIIEGLFRKCVVADNCALIANAAFDGRLGSPSLPVLLLGMYAFAWQIYGDFSGYSNIARGSAQLFGFHFMVNFRQPYLATSLQDFWRRWHISLSSWLRDYLYIALGGNRFGVLKTYRNLMLTMLLGGLWHGANWVFVIWGGIHGGGLALERLAFGDGASTSPASTQESRSWLTSKDGFVSLWIRRIFIFHLVAIAWVFFRAVSVSQAFSLLSGAGSWSWSAEFWVALKFLLLFATPLFAIDLWLEKTGDEYMLQTRPVAWRIAAGVAVAVLVILLSANQANAFIYFQF